MKIQESERGDDIVLFTAKFNSSEERDDFLGWLCQEPDFYDDNMRIHPDGNLYFHRKYPKCYSTTIFVFDHMIDDKCKIK